MKQKQLKLPAIILAIGLVLTVLSYLVTSVRKFPTVTEQDFEYSVTYELNGEIKTYEGVYTCRFSSFGANGLDPLTRNYDGEYTVEGETSPFRDYTIAEADGYRLYIVTLFNGSFLMGDTKNESYSPLTDPFLEAVDEEGCQYSEEELPEVFDAKIVSWEYPDPIENTFAFYGFSLFHADAMAAMIFIGLLTLVSCMIFVKKDDGVLYSIMDKIGTLLNFAVMILALPVLTITAVLIQAYPTGPDWIYQVYLIIPPMIPLTVAASVSLRRKGFRKSGFWIQFSGPVLLVIVAVLEYVLP